MQVRDLKKKGFHERFHDDSRGRRWDFVQKSGFSSRFAADLPSDHPWNLGKLVWKCSECGGEEPIKYDSFIHDEVIVPDPTAQLDAHDCDLSRVRQVMDS
jgi:hypothetical protein